MSLALGAVITAVLLLPGIVFRYLYIRSDGLRKAIDLSLLNETIFILFSSLVLHVAGRAVMERVFKQDWGVEQLYLVLNGDDEPDFRLINANLDSFIFYILALCIISGVLAVLFQKLVVRQHWDEKIKVLRIYNDWDKYLSGRVLDLEVGRDFDYVQVDVLVNADKQSILYSGILENYTLNKEQGIDRLFLSGVYRRDFDKNALEPLHSDQARTQYAAYRVSEAKQFDERYYPMPGNFLVIPFGEVQNLNISYIRIKELTSQATG